MNRNFEHLDTKLEECNDCIKDTQDEYKENTRNLLAGQWSRKYWQNRMDSRK